MFTYARSLLLLAGASGCMLTPTDDQRVSSTSEVLNFWGFTVEPRALVQVHAWDFNAHAMRDVGPPTIASDSPTTSLDMDLFEWKLDLALRDDRLWREGPAGGHCAIVGAKTTLDRGTGKTYNVMTVESKWGECLDDNPKVGQFYANCGASNNPVAKLYTESWRTVEVRAPVLDLAARLASPSFQMTLDNYTPTEYEFCSKTTPEGCPAGGASDPETWKHYRPNGSSITFAGSTMTFSIEPSRSDPMTIYIDDMNHVARTSSRLGFSLARGRFVLRINFEDADPEIRMNCIRDFWCPFVDGRTIDFTSPLFAELSFALAAEDGRVTYTDVTTKVSNGNADAAEAADGIASAITEMLMTDATIRDAVSTALDAVVRQSASLEAFPIEDVSISGDVLRVLPGCPME